MLVHGLRFVSHSLNEDVMLCYYGFGHLRADCGGPGSAPEPYARFAYGPIFTFYDSTTSVGFVFTVTFCQHRNKDR